MAYHRLDPRSMPDMHVKPIEHYGYRIRPADTMFWVEKKIAWFTWWPMKCCFSRDEAEKIAWQFIAIYNRRTRA